MQATPERQDFVEYRSVVGPARSVEMKHLITGGSGFIGNLTARRLRERGDGVRLLDIWADPSRPKDIAFINSSVIDRDGVAADMSAVDVVHHNARSEESRVGQECVSTCRSGWSP